MADTKQLSGVAEGSTPGEQRSVHHGRTWASWVGSLTALVAFVIGGFAVVFQNWVVFGLAVVLLIGAAVAVKVLQRMGYGAG